MVEHVPFDVGHWQVRQVAFASLSGQAQVVGIVASVALGLGIDEPGGAPVCAAAFAVEQPLEVVVEHAVALPAGGSVLDDFLDAFEQVSGDDRLVAPGECLTLVANDADVVRVAEYAVQMRSRQLFGAATSLRSRLEPQVGHGLLETVDRVVAGGIQFERLLDQRGAFFVDGDSVDLAPGVVEAHVAVADRGSAVGAAHLCLVAHLDLDVLSGHAYLDFVDDVGDGFHGIGHDAFAEVFLGGDEFDSHCFEAALGDDRVAQVAEGTRAHVDDHQ
ncbi:hypothetical protein A5639_25395 [Mycolicibacterium conceptionense]|nr:MULTISPECIES: hypothetical protein [Mycobacteriales]OBK01583.1 hypothetical protein A5639_25395 [Mycolicibacterium conceptionense]